MAWLKRNLGLVISAVVSLALLGLATYYLLTKKATADEASANLEKATQELKRLVTRNPGVSKENIAEAKEDQKKIEVFLEEIKQFFVTPSYPTQLNNREFGVLMLSKTGDLRRIAKSSGVTLPQDYQFSFASQVKSPNIPSNAVETLALQLAEIESICHVLFRSGLHELNNIRRQPVTPDETAGATEFLTAKGVTNEYTIIAPYDFVFRGFSGDLANVLQGLIKASNCVVVRDIVVQRADSAEVEEAETQTYSYGPTPMPGSANPYARYGLRGMGPGMSPELARRYGLRPSPVTPAPAPPQPTGKGGSSTVQDEHLLKITLSLETVRVRPPGLIVKAAPPPSPLVPLDPSAPPPEPGTETATP